jgi:hypothetical protein
MELTLDGLPKGRFFATLSSANYITKTSIGTVEGALCSESTIEENVRRITEVRGLNGVGAYVDKAKII